jgi:hypothetical protein
MQVLQPIEIDIISVREIPVQNIGAIITGTNEVPAYLIFGLFSTKTQYAYSTEEKISEHKSYFEAVMGEHPVSGRFFVRIGTMNGGGGFSDLFRDIIASHLLKLDLIGTCDTYLETSHAD